MGIKKSSSDKLTQKQIQEIIEILIKDYEENNDLKCECDCNYDYAYGC